MPDDYLFVAKQASIYFTSCFMQISKPDLETKCRTHVPLQRRWRSYWNSPSVVVSLDRALVPLGCDGGQVRFLNEYDCRFRPVSFWYLPVEDALRCFAHLCVLLRVLCGFDL